MLKLIIHAFGSGCSLKLLIAVSKEHLFNSFHFINLYEK